mgnify:CR=1 FL=1
MNRIILILSVLFASNSVLSQEAISTSGGEAVGSGGSVSYTIGQVFYSSLSGSNGKLTEGVQQPLQKTTYIFDNAWEPSNPNGIATTRDHIVIESGDATISVNTISNYTTIHPGAGLIVNAGATLSTLNGLTLQSSSTNYSSLILDGNISGSIFYERHVNSNGSGTTGGNDLISAPLTGQAFNTFAAVNTNIYNNGTLFAFGPFEKVTGTYVTWAGTETATLDAGVGYRAATSNNGALTFTGTANKETITNTIINSESYLAEWNLIGNPYPSYLNVQQFLSHDVGGVTNIQLFDTPTAAIYGYDGNAQNGWTIYNLANTTPVTLIAPGQGFFVSADPTNAPLYDLEFTSVMRSTGSGDDFILGRNAELTYLKLIANTNSNAYVTDFYFNENASLGFDVGYDAAIWDSTTTNFAIYSHLVEDNTGQSIALQSINSTDISNVSIPLGVLANQGEQITFSIFESTLPESISIYLDDTVANTSTLLNNLDYVITPTTALTGTGRFYLRISEDALSTINNSHNALNIFSEFSTDELVISGSLKQKTSVNLYDIQGRLVLTRQLNIASSQNRIDVSSLSEGVYLVEVKNNNQQKSQKVIIK